MIPKNSLIIKLLIKHVMENKKLSKSFDFSNPLQKYHLSEYLYLIFIILEIGAPLRHITQLKTDIGWNSVNKVYTKLNKAGIFKIAYTDLLRKYLKKCPGKKLRYVLTDTSFVPNKKGKDMYGYNKFYNRKNGTKISLITDSNGVPLNMKCYKGNKYDSPILLNHLKNSDIVCTDHITQYKQYFLADPGYDSKEIRKVLEDLNYEPIIAQNRRNTKDPAKLIKLTAHEETIYKKRLKIENTFSKIKMNRRLCLRYDSKIESFIGFLYLSFIKMIHAYK